MGSHDQNWLRGQAQGPSEDSGRVLLRGFGERERVVFYCLQRDLAEFMRWL